MDADDGYLLFLLPRSWIAEEEKDEEVVYDKVLAICHQIMVSCKQDDNDSDAGCSYGWVIQRHESD